VNLVRAPLTNSDSITSTRSRIHKARHEPLLPPESGLRASIIIVWGTSKSDSCSLDSTSCPTRSDFAFGNANAEYRRSPRPPPVRADSSPIEPSKWFAPAEDKVREASADRLTRRIGIVEENQSRSPLHETFGRRCRLSGPPIRIPPPGIRHSYISRKWLARKRSGRCSTMWWE